MGQWDVRLLAATYRRADNDQLTIEMYGTLDDGRSITVRYTGFEPYFDVVEPTAEAVEKLRRDPDVRRVEDISLFYKGRLRRSAKVYVRFPWLVPDFRSRLRRDFDVLAADIPFHHRFIYDFDIGSCIRVFGKEGVGEYRTDLIVDMEMADGAPRFQNLPPFNPDLKVLSFDIENAIKDGTILTVCYVIREGSGQLRGGAPISGDERTIIDEFTRVIQEEDPDVITGYNIDNYDIPTVMERAKLVKAGKLAWGRDLSEPRKVGLRGWRLNGRLVVDAWWAAKIHLRPKQETLNHVAKLTLGEEKLDVEPSKMDEEWDRDREKVMRYCLKDAELALRILEYVGSLRRTMDLAAVSKLPMEDVQTSGNSTLIDSILIREADRVPAPYGPVGVPLTGNFDDDEEAIEGGYVHTIEPGLYHWVIVLDFKSMYPSLIIHKNICFTTLNDEGTIVAPNGARFLSKEQREGLLPRILQDLMAQRDDIKRKMKATTDPDEFRYYDGLQNAVKILMNAVYGVFASSFYRFTDRNIGSAITAFARETVKTLISRLEEEGINVVYGDTDSLFLQSPYNNLDDTVKFGTEISERFSREISQMEFQKVLEPLFSHGKKKRYVGRSVWPDNELLIRGYETRRTDAFDLQSSVLMSVFEKILDERTEEAVKIARENVQKAMDCKVPIESLVISRTCKSFNSYKDPDSQANVQAARKLMAMGYDFVPGMKVSWIVTDSRKTPQEVEPYVSGRKFEHRPDCRYYAERVAQTAARATEVFGWGEKDLLTGSQQVTLFDTSFAGGSEPRAKKKEPEQKSTKKKMDLRDFM
ncbi:MAG: DNA polymerase II [Methanomassiliicoccus sp.]|nr:DNA polymerase II [Methanomassiliicoccus sp.]